MRHAPPVRCTLTETAGVCHRTRRVFDRRSWLAAAVLAAGVAWLSPFVAHARGGGGRGLCATAAAEHSAPPYVAVVSAFPAELAPIVAATEIETTVQIAGRSFYVGRLGGVSVLLGLTGIGIVNATNRAHDLLAHAQDRRPRHERHGRDPASHRRRRARLGHGGERSQGGIPPERRPLRPGPARRDGAS